MNIKNRVHTPAILCIAHVLLEANDNSELLADKWTKSVKRIGFVEEIWLCMKYRGADKSLARPGMKQARKHVRDERDFNNIETRAVIKLFFSLQGKAPKEIHAILTETLTCFLPGRAEDLSAPL